MKIYLYTATKLEAHWMDVKRLPSQHQYKVVVSGVGIMHATYHILESILNQQPDLMIQFGIAGAYKRNLSLSEVVVVAQDQLGDAGVENHHRFEDLFDLELNENSYPFTQKKLINPFISKWGIELPHVNALTVNTGSGSVDTIKKRISKYNPDIETMEGAPFHYAALKHNIPFIQFRGISNYVEPRNRESWQVDKALENVSNTISSFIENQLR